MCLSSPCGEGFRGILFPRRSMTEEVQASSLARAKIEVLTSLVLEVGSKPRTARYTAGPA